MINFGAETDRGRLSGFDILRHLAAVAVLFSHSFAIVGQLGNEPLRYLTGGTLTIGEVAVLVFFTISGFLIAQSAERSTFATYAMKRCLRIMPGLIVVVAVTATIIGPIVTTKTFSDYLHSAEFHHYFRLILFLPDSGQLPGVFSDNRYPYIANLSLWTLRHEVTCYALLALVLLTKCRVAASILISAACSYACFAHLKLPNALSEFVTLAPFFFSASAIYFLRMHINIRPYLVIFTFACILATSSSRVFVLAWPFCLSYLLISVVILLSRKSTLLRSDYSYGIYLYAFPIQQVIERYFSAPWWLNVCLALPATIGAAALSWRFVERPAMKRGPQSIMLLSRGISSSRRGGLSAQWSPWRRTLASPAGVPAPVENRAQSKANGPDL
jgi:peptidoglycan/LPS O-acetylase OafA/YrhL